MSKAKTLYWHDYETFGIDARLDRPTQFAGQRTDLALNPIGEPLLRYCQPPTDVLPQPEACLVTGITPQMANERGVPEPAFIADIHAEMAVPGTCSVGYNSLRFDDEFTRHTLWRNFFDPYRREWAEGCSKWDLIDVARLTYALRPEGIAWPQRDDGAPSFRLEDLAAANELAQAQAHDALSDVTASIELARLLRARQPKLYDFAFNNRGKAAARQLLDLKEYKPVVHVSEKFPAALGCLSLVMPIAAHPANANAVIVFDLRHDPDTLLNEDVADLRERLFTPAADLPEGEQRLAVKAVHVNKCPVLAPVKTLDAASAKRLQLDLDTCRAHWKALHANLDAVADKLRAVFERGETSPHSDPEQDLYGGFVSDDDRRLCEQVRSRSGVELARTAPTFSDARLQAMFWRYRARHYPESLDAAETADWQAWRANRLTYAPDGGLCLDDYDALVSVLPEHVGDDPKKLQLLLDLKAWGQRLRSYC